MLMEEEQIRAILCNQEMALESPGPEDNEDELRGSIKTIKHILGED